MLGNRTPMRHEDHHMVPKVVVQAMFALMIGSMGIVAYAQLADVPQAGVLVEAPIVAERTVILTGDRTGIYTVADVDGTPIAISNADKAGFIGVIGRVFAFERDRMGVALDAPVRVVRRDNGNIAVLDDATGLNVELIGYGVDNVAAFARLIDD